MKKDVVRGIFLMILTLDIVSVFAQEICGSTILDRFDRRFNELDSLVCALDGADSSTAQVGVGLYYAGDTLYLHYLDSVMDVSLKNKVEAEVSAFKSKTGLQVTGSAYYRFFDAFGSDEDDVSSYYNGKISAELRWAPFQSALFKRKGKIDEMHIKNEIERLTYEKERMGISAVGQKEHLRQYYDSLQSGVLRHRIYNLNLLGEAYDYLLKNENISSDELLNILNDKAEAERKLMSLGGGYPEAGDLTCPVSTVVKVDTAAFLRNVRENHIELKTLGLRMDLLEQQERNVSYWSGVGVDPFVRYSYYNRPAYPNSYNVDAGVNLRFPISAEAKKEKRSIRAEREILSHERNLFLSQTEGELLFILEDIERLNASITGEVKRSMELLNYLNIRKEAYENRIGEYNRLARMKEYNSYILCIEKMLDFCYRRDCQIANLSRYLVKESMTMFLYEEEIQ